MTEFQTGMSGWSYAAPFNMSLRNHTPVHKAPNAYPVDRPATHREARRQQIESRYCPLATCEIIHNAKNNCQRDSCERRENFRQYGTLSNSSHIESGAQNALTNQFVNSFMRFYFQRILALAATPQARHADGVTLVSAKLEKISIA